MIEEQSQREQGRKSSGKINKGLKSRDAGDSVPYNIRTAGLRPHRRRDYHLPAKKRPPGALFQFYLYGQLTLMLLAFICGQRT